MPPPKSHTPRTSLHGLGPSPEPSFLTTIKSIIAAKTPSRPSCPDCICRIYELAPGVTFGEVLIMLFGASGQIGGFVYMSIHDKGELWNVIFSIVCTLSGAVFLVILVWGAQEVPAHSDEDEVISGNPPSSRIWEIMKYRAPGTAEPVRVRVRVRVPATIGILAADLCGTGFIFSMLSLASLVPHTPLWRRVLLLVCDGVLVSSLVLHWSKCEVIPSEVPGSAKDQEAVSDCDEKREMQAV